MKINLVLILFFPLFFFAQQSAGIYTISFPISQKLLQATRVQTTTNGGSLGFVNSPGNLGFNNNLIPPFAPFLHDSVRLTLEKFVGEVLSSETVCIYRMNKKNEVVSSSSFPGSIRGLPRNNLSNAINFYEKDLGIFYKHFYKSLYKSLNFCDNQFRNISQTFSTFFIIP